MHVFVGNKKPRPGPWCESICWYVHGLGPDVIYIILPVVYTVWRLSVAKILLPHLVYLLDVSSELDMDWIDWIGLNRCDDCDPFLNL